MKNAVISLCCRKSLLLVLTLLCGVGPGYAGGNGGAQSSQLVISSLSKAMPELKHLQYRHKSKPLPFLKVGILSLMTGSGVVLMGNYVTQDSWITGLGALLTVCGVLFCAGKAIIGKDNERGVLKAGVFDIVIYESDGVYHLGQINSGGAKKIASDGSLYTTHTSVISADDVHSVIKAKQIRHILNKDHFQTLADQQNSEQPPLNYLREVSGEFLGNTVIAFSHGGDGYLKKISEVRNTDDGGVELSIGSNLNRGVRNTDDGEGEVIRNSRDGVVISVDSEGIPALYVDGELRSGNLKGMIFLPE